MNICKTIRAPFRGLFAKSEPLTPKQNKILNIFFYLITACTVLSLIGIVLCYVYAYAALSSGSRAFDGLLGIFSDFVFIMSVSLEDSPYILEEASSYPPLAIAILYPFALICKNVFSLYAAEQFETVDLLTAKVVLHKEFWVALLLFFVICSAAVILTLIKAYRLPPDAALKVALTTLFSAPFVFAIMRGNTIYFAFIFLLLFLWLYESESAALREIGYLCLVVAGLIKIYPLFFGVFLLCKKRLWASVRIGVYTVALFLLSFLIFRGAEDLAPFVDNLGGFASNPARLIAANNLSVTAMLYKLFRLVSVSAADSSVFSAVNLCALLAIFAVSTVTAVYTRSSFSRTAIAASVAILIPSVSYFYVLIFAFLPFMEFIRGYDSFSSAKRGLYIAIFSLLLLTPTLIPFNYIPHSAAVMVMLVVECVGVIKNEMLRKRKKAASADTALSEAAVG